MLDRGVPIASYIAARDLDPYLRTVMRIYGPLGKVGIRDERCDQDWAGGGEGRHDQSPHQPHPSMPRQRFVSSAQAAAFLGLARSTFDYQRRANSYVLDSLTGEVVGSYLDILDATGYTGQDVRRHAESLRMACPVFGGIKPARGQWRFDLSLLGGSHE